MPFVTTPLWRSVRMTLTLPKWGLGSPSETPKNSKFDCRGQNTSPWNVLYTIGKVLKFRCQKMASHEPFGHMQHMLWTKKSKIDSTPMCAGGVRHTVGKLLRRATSLFETSPQLEVWARSYELPKSQESKPGQFRNFSLGVLGKSAIQM